MALAHKRILLKLSGEALCGQTGGFGLDPKTVEAISAELADVHSLGAELGIVIGGGNIFRGLKGSAQGMDRASADYMGMLATVINGVALQDSLEKHGVQTRLMTALEVRAVAEPYIRRRAMRHLEKGRVVIFAAGTGNPFFTTDTTAALRAVELGADALLKASKVDGIYDADPATHPDAKRLDELSYMDFISDELRVMDTTAVTMSKEHGVPIVVFDMTTPGNIVKAVSGEKIGTVIH